MTPPFDSPIIELRGVVKRFGAVEALKATTLSLGVGANVLLGPSGSGKSTLLRLLTGLAGIPTLHYGPGDARLAHGPDESVPLAEVEMAARTLALVALDVTRAS